MVFYNEEEDYVTWYNAKTSMFKARLSNQMGKSCRQILEGPQNLKMEPRKHPRRREVPEVLLKF